MPARAGDPEIYRGGVPAYTNGLLEQIRGLLILEHLSQAQLRELANSTRRENHLSP